MDPVQGRSAVLAAAKWLWSLCLTGAFALALAPKVVRAADDWTGIVNPPYRVEKAAVKTLVGADAIPAAKDPKLPIREFLVTVVAADSGKPIANARITSVLGVDDWRHMPVRKTDANGQYLIRVAVPNTPDAPPEVNSISVFTVQASHPNYAPAYASVNGNANWLLKNAATNLTLKLEQGVSIGGQVIDDKGKPVVGAKIWMSGNGVPQNAYSQQQSAWSNYPSIAQTDEDDPSMPMTGPDGRWSFAHFPADLDQVEITAVSPDGSRTAYGHQAPWYQSSNPALDLGDLKAAKAVFTLKTGFAVHGVVVDESGKPVAGAVVHEGYGFNNHTVTSSFLTDAQGRFERLNRVKRQWIYTASAPGKALGSAIASVDSNTPPVRIVLLKERPLTIKAMAPDGKPLAKASVMANPWQNQGQILDWNGETDAAGAVVWTNRPLTKLVLTLTAPEHGMRTIKAALEDTEKTVDFHQQVASKVSIRITGAEAETKKPVTISKILLRAQEWMPARTLTEPNASSATVTVNQSELQGNTTFLLRVEAKGYIPAKLEGIDFNDGDQALEAVLRPSKPVDVQLVDADGNPAVGARCWVRVQENGQQLYINGSDQYFGQEAYEKPTVSPEGKVRLPLGEDATPVIATTEKGIGTSTLGKLRADPTLKLEAFGQISGTCYIGTNVAKNINVNLQMLVWSQSNPFQLSMGSMTRPNGHFEFNKVPPGQYKLVRFRQHMGPMTESHAQPVTVKPGETLEVKYGGVGRAVIGQAQSAPDDVPVDWKNDDHTLSNIIHSGPMGNQLNVDDYATLDAWNEALRLNNNGGNAAAIRENRTYVLELDEDGNFRVDDVAPGKYNLTFTITKPKKRQEDYWNRRPDDEVGALHKEIVVPEGTGDFDLGTITVPVHGNPVAANSTSLSLKATDLEGKPWDLESLRGKTVVLCLWASWSDRSEEMLKLWPKLVEEFGKNGQAVFVSVALGESPTAIKAAVQERGYGWQQVTITGKPAIDWLDRYNISELPYCVVVGPDGKTKGAGLEPKRLAATIAKSAKTKL